MLKRLILLAWHLALLAGITLSMAYHNTALYLIGQAYGQWRILSHTQPIEDYTRTHTLNARQLSNLGWIDRVRQYASDSLGFVPVNSYTRIYDQGHEPILWAITACSDTALEPYYWHFPVLGAVSYKGYFVKNRALAELNHLGSEGYDVEIRPVSAWSTLGWLNDPVLSHMLDMQPGKLCNLLFHELFHSTYYAPGSVEENENLASFIGDKATLRFLRNDTAQLNAYIRGQYDMDVFRQYMMAHTARLDTFYTQHPVNRIRKLRMLWQIAQGIERLPLHDPQRYRREKEDIMRYQNAYFIGFRQYHQKHDSLETAFNKIYQGDLRNMVSYLKLKSGK